MNSLKNPSSISLQIIHGFACFWNQVHKVMVVNMHLLVAIIHSGLCFIISENSRKFYVANLANDVHCNFPPEALMNTVSSYEAAYWLEQISYNFLIWFCLAHRCVFGLISMFSARKYCYNPQYSLLWSNPVLKDLQGQFNNHCSFQLFYCGFIYV